MDDRGEKEPVGGVDFVGIRTRWSTDLSVIYLC